MLRADSNNTTIFCCLANSATSAVGILLSLAMATAAVANIDAGQNDDFASAQILPAGSLTVSGELEFDLMDAAIAQQSGTLTPGGVVFHDFDVTAGETFTVAIDNVSGTDTTLGALDGSFNLIATDDDSSFLGTGLGSSLTVTGNPDGRVLLLVSGFSDFDFDGLSDGGTIPHPQAGDYDVFVFDRAIVGDVDVYAFTGLTAGERFIAETFAGTSATAPDTVLGLFDDLGTLVATNDDGGVGLFSQLDVTVPASGTLIFGVSGFSDFGFDGSHSASGTYSLSLEAVAVPEPTGFALLTFALVATGLRRQR